VEQGSPTQVLAFHLGHSIIARADFYLDLHSAGVKLLMPSMVGYDATDPRSREAAVIFGAPVVWGHPAIPPGRTISFAASRGIPWLYTEARGAGRIDAEDLAMFKRGVLNLLRYLHMLPGRVTPARFAVSAQCHRVNVVDGHMAAVRVTLDRAADPAELREAFASFTGVPQELRLPSAPARPILVRDEPDRPQPRLDRDAGGGMSISVGRIARDGVLGHRFIAVSHNTIRGAAGAAILNAELLLAKGYLGGP